MTCIDFNLIMYDYGSKFLKGAKHEPRSNCVLADHGLLSTTAFQVVRRSIIEATIASKPLLVSTSFIA